MLCSILWVPKLIKISGCPLDHACCALDARPPVHWDKGKLYNFNAIDQALVSKASNIPGIDRRRSLKSDVSMSRQCKKKKKIENLWFFYCLTGRASIYILRTAFGLDWSERIRIIYAGDDNTDEDAMLVSILFFKLVILFNGIANSRPSIRKAILNIIDIRM